ncbi:MAG: response regulator transcription factor [Cyanobacteria bacterium SZAS LIN-3]|nr:response regulator transcription factor [Cyanobacteria bacterium SZAS LIN-3]
MKILIAEDLPSLREHAQKLIEKLFSNRGSKLDHVLFAENGLEAVRLAKAENFDLIIMDVAMPELNGIKAASEIWAAKPTTKILFWSQYHYEAYIRELGKIVPDEAIHGYVLKTESDEKVLEAINSIVFYDLPFIVPAVEAVKARLKDRSSAVTDLEYETLLDIAAGLTDKAIARKEHISYRGAQNRLSMLLSKLLKGEDGYLKESAGMEIYNPRARLMFEALKRGLITQEDLSRHAQGVDEWLFSEFGYEVEEKV